MNNKQNYRTCVGGIILLVLSIIGLITGLATNIRTVVTMLQHQGATGIVTAVTIIGSTVVSSAALIVLSLLLTMKKHGKILTIVALAAAGLIAITRIPGNLLTVFTNIANMPRMVFYSLMILLTNLAYAASLASVGLLSAKATGKDPASAAKLKLLPCIVYLVYALFAAIASVAVYFGYTGTGTSNIVVLVLTNVFSSLLGNVLPLVCWFLICGWIVDPYAKTPAPQQVAPAAAPQPSYQPPVYSQPTYQAPQYQAPQYQVPQQQPDPAAAQELGRYQQMLQAGVITQEEYNAARARILGL